MYVHAYIYIKQVVPSFICSVFQNVDVVCVGCRDIIVVLCVQKLMGQTLEKWRMARGEWVDALDNLTQLQRDKILEWLTSSGTPKHHAVLYFVHF